MRSKTTPLQALFSAQFLSAFVDNMILFIVQAILQRDSYPAYYLPFVQSTFLASFVLFAPWVGNFADQIPKARVLMIGNLLKSAGVALLILGFDPAVSYAVVGVGAVVYSPAKYGILPFLTRNEDELLKANAGLESYTILAILLGSVAGGVTADISIALALGVCLLLYGFSMGINLLIPNDPGGTGVRYRDALREFGRNAVTLLQNRQSHYSLIGTGSFWMASAVLRMIIFAWVPLTLHITSGTAISMIIAVTGLGVAVGAAITPYVCSMKTYHRTVWFGFGMGALILSFLGIETLPAAVVGIFFIGVQGGIYIVPMNACLQQVGQGTVGAGKSIAIQNLIQNGAMFVGVGCYTLAARTEVAINLSLGTAGVVFLLLVTYLYFYSRQR